MKRGGNARDAGDSGEWAADSGQWIVDGGEYFGGKGIALDWFDWAMLCRPRCLPDFARSEKKLVFPGIFGCCVFFPYGFSR